MLITAPAPTAMSYNPFRKYPRLMVKIIAANMPPTSVLILSVPVMLKAGIGSIGSIEY